MIPGLGFTQQHELIDSRNRILIICRIHTATHVIKIYCWPGLYRGDMLDIGNGMGSILF
jgi:hypothetical protein